MTHAALVAAERRFRDYLADIERRGVPIPWLRDVYFDRNEERHRYQATARFVPRLPLGPPTLDVATVGAIEVREEFIDWHISEVDLVGSGIRRERYPEYCTRIWRGLCGDIPIVREIDHLNRTQIESGAPSYLLGPMTPMEGRIQELEQQLYHRRQEWMPRPEVDARLRLMFQPPPMFDAAERIAEIGHVTAVSMMEGLAAFRREVLREYIHQNLFTPYIMRHNDDEAEQRANSLLLDWLTPAQRAQYEKEKHFDVVGSAGNRYRILEGRNSNVVRLDERGQSLSKWCFVPRGIDTIGDVMLAQKIALENFEDEAMAKANPVDLSAREIFWPNPLRP